jgi:superfamily I DNA/RNA helicase
MFLASCGYMLHHLINEMRATGTPFYNPFKKDRGDLNPLGSFNNRFSKTIYGKDRLLSFLDKDGPRFDNKVYWNMEQLNMWASIINSAGIMRRGAKVRIAEELEHPTIFTPESIARFFDDCFEEHARGHLLDRDIEWLNRHLVPTKVSSIKFPSEVYRNNGMAGLAEKPKIIISTIHGVKGGESDVVFLFPDLSIKGIEDWKKGGAGRDAIIRMMYVGMTRAKESLIICAPSTGLFVTL